ncbi:zinc-dependent alcohol dehydrogenase [Paenibacillus sp. MBLB4367]|uniref:zinc-dependent alcohol dehydrogenase n=1 Tax=Paenibacillus sp. MBLB4367 TaxID=3384767 RepID=UPI0039081A3F
MRAVVGQYGKALVIEENVQEVKEGFVLVKTAFSAISAGTEMTGLKYAGTSFASLGYSAAGTVAEVGGGVRHVKANDRVACYGSPYVKHAEYILVPKHLVVPVPHGVGLLEASTVGLGTIAVHALRQADLRFGEHVVVIGLGLLGQLVAQLADAASAQVIAYDVLQGRCDRLRGTGSITVCTSVEETEEAIRLQTGGAGVDAVIVCASGRETWLIDQSLKWLRDRGKVVIVGDLDMTCTRELMFQKEAQLLISRAGGPGRYDPVYEAQGFDYPIGFVRWTEGRNMAEYLRLLASRRIAVAQLITHQVPLEDASFVYERFVNDPHQTLGVVFAYA